MNDDLKFRLNSLLLAYFIGLLMGLCVGGWLVANIPGTLWYACTVVAGAFVTSLAYILKHLDK